METTNWTTYYGAWPLIDQNLRVQPKEISSVKRISSAVNHLLTDSDPSS